MRFRVLFSLMLFALAFTAAAQNEKPGLQVFAARLEDRGETRLLYWDGAKNTAAGQLVVHHGRPTWRPEYDDPKNFDAMTKGKTWRLGKDFWTELSTDLPLKIAGKEIVPGAYYLGAERSAEGASWSLVFFDPAQVRAAHIDASQIEKATAAFKVPLTFTAREEKIERLSITLTQSPENPSAVTLSIHWGGMELTTPVQVGI